MRRTARLFLCLLFFTTFVESRLMEAALAQEDGQSVRISSKKRSRASCCGTQGCSICCPSGTTAVCDSGDSMFSAPSCTCR